MESITEKELSNKLHIAGLDAFQNYAEWGKSSEHWDTFRLKIAKYLLENLKITNLGLFHNIRG